MTDPTLTRRDCLRGMGCALFLPWMESLPFANPRRAAGKPPIRMGFLSIPNGVNVEHWRMPNPTTLSPTLQPLKAVLKDVLICQNLRHQKAYGNGDGPGDHARETGTFLTGVQLRKTAGDDIQAGVSIDQLAAQRAGHLTPLASLELGLDGSGRAGNCDSGYSCLYSSNISWRNPTTANMKETDPRAVYKRLFLDLAQSDDQQVRAGEVALRRSMLDLVREDASRLQRDLAGNDRHKLGEYLESVRELEQRIQRFGLGQASAGIDAPKVDFPEGNDHVAYTRIMLDLIALAWQADVTRITTFMFGNGGSNRVYRHLGITGGHHDLSHHGGDAKKVEAIRTIDKHLVEQFVYFVEKLASITESDGRSLLDYCMVLYGSGLADGDRHNHSDLPILLAGSGGGSIKPGRVFPANAAMCDLFLAMMARFGTPVDAFGDSTKMLELPR